MDRPRNANTHVSETNQKMNYSAPTIFFQYSIKMLSKQTFTNKLESNITFCLFSGKFCSSHLGETCTLILLFFSITQATYACYSESPNLMSQLSNTHASKYSPTQGR